MLALFAVCAQAGVQEDAPEWSDEPPALARLLESGFKAEAGRQPGIAAAHYCAAARDGSVEGQYRLGRLFLEEGLRAANLDPNGEEARTARQRFDTLIGAFEPIEGKPPTMADIRGLVGDVLPRGEGDQNVVRVGGAPAEGIGNTEIAPQEGGEGSGPAGGRPLCEAQARRQESRCRSPGRR